MGEHIAEVIGLLTFVALLFVGLAKWIAARTIAKVDTHDTELTAIWKKIAAIELSQSNLEIKILKELSVVKSNYISRFDDVQRTLNRHHEEVITKIADQTTAISNQEQFCFLIQEAKKQKDKEGKSDKEVT